MNLITKSTIKKQLTQLRLIDIREPWEFDNGHIEAAENIPMQHFIASLDTLETSSHKPTVIYCQTGGRTEFVAQLCDAKGLKNILHYKAGYSDWVTHDN